MNESVMPKKTKNDHYSVQSYFCGENCRGEKVLSMRVCVCVCLSTYMCVYERHREKEKELERENEWEREKEWERERECVCFRERNYVFV